MQYWVVAVTQHTMSEAPEPGSLPHWNEKVIYMQRVPGEGINLQEIIQAVNSTRNPIIVKDTKEEV